MNDAAKSKGQAGGRPRPRRWQFGLLSFLLLTTLLPAPALAWVQVLRETWTQRRIVSELKQRCGKSIALQVVWAREPENEWTALLGQRRVVEISLSGYQGEPVRSSRLPKEILELVGRLPHLETLTLEHVYVEFEGMRALGNAESIGWLKGHECEFEEGEFPTVGTLRNLVSVDFTGSTVGNETVQLLVKLPHLRSVDLRKGHVSQESMELLAGSPHLGFVATPLGIYSSGRIHQEGQPDLVSCK